MKKKKNSIKNDFDKVDPSKSAKKRECLALQKLGEELGKLSVGQREKIELSDELREALNLYEKISGYEGKRRQMQFIGKLIRKEDTMQISKIKNLISTLKNG